MEEIKKTIDLQQALFAAEQELKTAKTALQVEMDLKLAPYKEAIETTKQLYDAAQAELREMLSEIPSSDWGTILNYQGMKHKVTKGKESANLKEGVKAENLPSSIRREKIQYSLDKNAAKKLIKEDPSLAEFVEVTKSEDKIVWEMEA